jgi:hypothetical protein
MVPAEVEIALTRSTLRPWRSGHVEALVRGEERSRVSPPGR